MDGLGEFLRRQHRVFLCNEFYSRPSKDLCFRRNIARVVLQTNTTIARKLDFFSKTIPKNSMALIRPLPRRLNEIQMECLKMLSQSNALAEIALALAMAFFSIMILSMVSMGAVSSAEDHSKIAYSQSLKFQGSSETEAQKTWTEIQILLRRTQW